jgi:hypothetical protein
MATSKELSNVSSSVDRIALELELHRIERERQELAQYIYAKRESFEYRYTSKSGLVGVLVGLFSKQKKVEQEELAQLYAQQQENARRINELRSLLRA